MAIDESGTRALLTGRSEGFIAGRPDLKQTIRRLQAFAEAGADCLFAPGLRSIDDIRTVVAEVAPVAVNVLVSSSFTSLQELSDIGRRVGTQREDGGALARSAWTGFMECAREIAANGTFTNLDKSIPGHALNELFVES